MIEQRPSPPEQRQPLTELQVVEALEANDGNVTRAAEALGVTRQGLWEAMQRIGIEVRKVVRRRETPVP